jgi:hypothetical protein
MLASLLGFRAHHCQRISTALQKDADTILSQFSVFFSTY